MEGVGIRRVTGAEAEESLKERREMGIDPFGQGFSLPDMKKKRESVKLCFEVSLTHIDGSLVQINPVLSQTISNTKCKEMRIVELAPNHAISNQPESILIFAENLPTQGDTVVVFDADTWSLEVKPEFQLLNNGLKILSPIIPNVLEPKTVKIKLLRKSNNFSTDPVSFKFEPPKNQLQLNITRNLQTNLETKSKTDKEMSLSIHQRSLSLLQSPGLPNIRSKNVDRLFEDLPELKNF